MAIETRPYAAGDETAICALFETVFGRALSPSFWRWRYAGAPAGGPLTQLCWDEGRLVGHYGASASFLAVDGLKQRAGMSMTTMVHPDYRGRQLFEQAGAQLYERLAAEGYALIYGFPNAMIHRARTLRLGWRDIYEMPTLTCAQAAAAAAGRNPPGAIAPVVRFDARFDAFWAQSRMRARLWSWRDAAWLNWRFCDNPQNAYRAAAFVEAGAVQGYAVVKPFGADGLDLVELFAFEPPTIEGLIAWVLEEARAAGRGVISAWAQPHDRARMALEAVGFRAGAPVTYFGGRPLPALAGGPDMFDPRNWRLAMADSDVY